METIVKNLNKEGTNLYLKSATGTGKTLSLLCACLTWLEQNNNSKTKTGIIYCSKTHHQLSHVFGDFMKTLHKSFSIITLGSREAMSLTNECKCPVQLTKI